MSKIRLNGTTSGYTEIAPPATAGDNTITLPSSNGSANQFLKNGSTAGTLGWSSMVETATGVGIGTSSPEAVLQTVATSSGAATVGAFLQNYSATTNTEVRLAFGPAANSLSDNRYAWIGCVNTGGSNGTAFTFNTGPGGTAATERARIDSAGRLGIGKTPDDSVVGVGIQFNPLGLGIISRSSGSLLALNRTTNDGNLIEFYQDSTLEGNINVSGTTVALSGAHLNRWSQISGIDPHDKDVRPEILRGTVMSNLDEMCDWIDPDSGEAQANEQLNKTKISDVEGDKNVAGVFQSWDDDDDTWVNDFYLAMTGDFVIRIAEGVTVERGDLLISAGDGTAKPQDDDLIRSSTVAKVTSTTVSHVHPDGSYCIPCVLMAC